MERLLPDRAVSNMGISRVVAAHYTHGNLLQALLQALRNTGEDVEALAIDDLAPVDEFHSRGRQATSDLSNGLGLREDMRVLDVGCGLGGVARRVAFETGASVTGIDLTEEYCSVAAELTKHASLSGRVEFRQADALNIPFDNGSFDAAHTRHVGMNIKDKSWFYAEIARVLKPHSGFGIYGTFQGPGGEVVNPVPWAADASMSFLIPPDDLPPLLQSAGFQVVSRRDTTEQARDWFAELQ
jgi:MPBQ/MSBQ methyltransferase